QVRVPRPSGREMGLRMPGRWLRSWVQHGPCGSFGGVMSHGNGRLRGSGGWFGQDAERGRRDLLVAEPEYVVLRELARTAPRVGGPGGPTWLLGCRDRKGCRNRSVRCRGVHRVGCLRSPTDGSCCSSSSC